MAAEATGHVSVHWPGFEVEEFIRRIQSEMAAHAASYGAVFIPNPRMAFFGGSRLPVTHPLGGVRMKRGPIDHGRGSLVD